MPVQAQLFHHHADLAARCRNRAGRTIRTGDRDRSAARTTRYPDHGLVLWTDRSPGSEVGLEHLEAAATTLADRLGITARPLFEARDAYMARAWVPLGVDCTVDSERMAATRRTWAGPVTIGFGGLGYFGVQIAKAAGPLFSSLNSMSRDGRSRPSWECRRARKISVISSRNNSM
jgi:hypothetical protein